MERLPGFRDFFPEPVPHQDVWSLELRNYIFNRWRKTARTYGFGEYDGPPLESLELYKTKSGDEIVGQLYNFIDKGDRPVALRPEMTPTLARMIAAHERSYRKPIKWFAIPQLFRYERQQKGRLREHFQFNADIFGEADAAADAELISLLVDSLRVFGLTSEDFVVRLSSRQAWEGFYEAGKQDRTKAPEFFQVIDKLEREKPEISDEKLHALGFSLAEVKTFIDRAEPTPELSEIVNNLAMRGLAEFIKIDYNVIRGLAYYTGVVFEAFDQKGNFRAIAGGGRYDNLVKVISGGKTHLPALGFGMGDVVLTELLKARGLLPAFEPKIDAFCLIEDESLRPDSLNLIHSLRETGYSVDYSLLPMKSDKQFKRAVDLNASHVLRIERAESGELVLRHKNMLTREEKSIPPNLAATSIREAS